MPLFYHSLWITYLDVDAYKYPIPSHKHRRSPWVNNCVGIGNHKVSCFSVITLFIDELDFDAQQFTIPSPLPKLPQQRSTFYSSSFTQLSPAFTPSLSSPIDSSTASVVIPAFTPHVASITLPTSFLLLASPWKHCYLDCLRFA